MKVEIKVVKENEDGSANAEIFLDEEAKDFLIRKAIIDALVAGIEIGKERTPKEEE